MVKPAKKQIIDIADDTPVALDVDPEAVGFIILKARAFDAKTAPVEPDPGSNETDYGEHGVLEDYPSDRTQEELRDAIAQLSDDAAIDLVALLWVGRGDYGRVEWREARALAAERATKPTVDYLMGEPNFGDFLEEGLAALGYQPSDYGPD
jgi:hypothetical protein